MKNEKKKFLGILLIIFAIIIIIVLILNNKKTTEEPIEPSVPKIEKRYEKVNDYKEYFTIQSTLNNNVDMGVSYVVKEIYVNSINDTNYYFIKSCKFMDDNYEDNLYFILITNSSSNYYELIEIRDNINDLADYSKNYDIKELNVNGSNKLSIGSYSEKIVLSMYMEYFKKLLVSNTQVAYAMLHEDTRAKYNSYEEFANNIYNIYEYLSSDIFSYSIDEENQNKIYYFENGNRNKIVIYEESIMNFKISY